LAGKGGVMEENITATICGDCGALISYNILTYRNAGNAGHGGASCGCKKENYKILFGAEASAFLKNYRCAKIGKGGTNG